jgi:hypothetical protein
MKLLIVTQNRAWTTTFWVYATGLPEYEHRVCPGLSLGGRPVAQNASVFLGKEKGRSA